MAHRVAQSAGSLSLGRGTDGKLLCQSRRIAQRVDDHDGGARFRFTDGQRDMRQITAMDLASANRRAQLFERIGLVTGRVGGCCS